MPRRSDSEWQVLTALWDSGGASLGEVGEALRPATGWSRNTVLTYLTRMGKKGPVTIDKEGNPHRYRAALARETCMARERQSFLSRVYRGSAGDLVAAFLKESPLSAEERDRLKALLDDMEV
mgnify:CR=1 FL=1